MPKFVLVRRDDDNLQPFDPRGCLKKVNIQPNHLAPFGPIWQADMEIEEAKCFNQAKFAIRATPSFCTPESENLPLVWD